MASLPEQRARYHWIMGKLASPFTDRCDSFADVDSFHLLRKLSKRRGFVKGRTFVSNKLSDDIGWNRRRWNSASVASAQWKIENVFDLHFACTTDLPDGHLNIGLESKLPFDYKFPVESVNLNWTCTQAASFEKKESNGDLFSLRIFSVCTASTKDRPLPGTRSWIESSLPNTVWLGLAVGLTRINKFVIEHRVRSFVVHLSHLRAGTVVQGSDRPRTQLAKTWWCAKSC